MIPSLRFKLLQLRRVRLFLLLGTGSDWLVRFHLPFSEVRMRASLSTPARAGYPLLVFGPAALGGLHQAFCHTHVSQLLPRVTCSSTVRGQSGHKRASLCYPLDSTIPQLPGLLLLTGLGSRGQSRIDLLFCLLETVPFLLQ